MASNKIPGGHWSRLAERGSVFGLRSVFFCYRLLGRSAAQLLLYPVVAYFFITGSKARAASLDFLRRVHRINRQRGGNTPEPGWRDSFRQMFNFGQSGLDKLAAWTGDLNCGQVDFPKRYVLDQMFASGRGAVLIGSHLGNLEMSRGLAINERHRKINAVLYTKHAHRFNALLKEANANFAVNFIQTSQLGPDTAILLKEKVDQGELVVIVGDRTPPVESGSTRVSLIDFLGEPAPFAQGPFILASLLECPVYLFFCLRQDDDADKDFRIHLELFAERIELPRKQRGERLQGYMRQYARRLEHYCLIAPLQWFNFYDFWRHDAAVHPDKE